MAPIMNTKPKLKVEKVNGRMGDYAIVDTSTGRRVITLPTRDMARDWLKTMKASPALRELYKV